MQLKNDMLKNKINLVIIKSFVKFLYNIINCINNMKYIKYANFGNASKMLQL